MPLAPAHRKLLAWQAALGFGLNAILNGGLAWLMPPPEPGLPMWARGNCVGGDVIGTSFFLPLVTCLVLTTLLRRSLRAGAMPSIPRAQLPAAIRWLPANVIGRGAVVGLASAATIAPLVLVGLGAAGVQALTPGHIVILKAVYTAFLGALVTPLLGLRALGDA
jgi:hypothetical protein